MTKHVTGKLGNYEADPVMGEGWQKLNDIIGTEVLDTDPLGHCMMAALVKLAEKVVELESKLEDVRFDADRRLDTLEASQQEKQL